MYFLSKFTSEVVLILILVVLDAEFYALSNSINIRGSHPEKIGEVSPKLLAKKPNFDQYFLSRSTSETVLTSNLVVLDAEFYSLSNDIVFNRDYQAKTAGFSRNSHFSPV